MITIICDTDAEQELLLAAMQDGSIDAVAGSLPFQLQRREPGRPPRSFAGGGTTTVTCASGASAMTAGGGGGGSSGRVSIHDHGSDEPCGPMCPSNPSPPGGNGGAGVRALG